MLPKISTPTFTLIQPSTKKELTYRPFLVKEEKILLMSKESGERSETFRAIKQIINNCILDDDFNIEDLPIFDLEYIFIKLRACSVDNTVKFQVEDSDDGITYDLELDLNEVEVIFPDEEINNKIMINDEFGIVLKYPTASISDAVENLTTLSDITYETINHSIVSIFDQENVYEWNKTTQEERDIFLNNLPINTYNKIQEFFTKIPKIEHIVHYTNSEGIEKKTIFRNLDDFFMLD